MSDMSDTTGPGTPPPPPYPSQAPFRLVRARAERRLGGVAGGLAVAAGLDPTLVRLGLVLAALTGWGLLAYIIAWAVIPEEDPAAGRPLVAAPEGTAQALRIGLAVAAALGALHLLGGLFGFLFTLIGGLFAPFGFYAFDDDLFFPGRALLGVALLVGGAVVLYRRRETLRSGSVPPVGPAPTGDRPAPPAAGGGSIGTAPPGAHPGAGGAGVAASAPAASAVAPRPATARGGPDAAGRSGREIALLVARAAGWLLLLWFVAAGLVVSGLIATGGLAVRWPALLAVATLGAVAVLGVTLVRSTRFGALAAAAAGLVVPVVLLLILGSLDGTAGSRTVVATSVDELQSSYRHSFGELRLDLSDLALPPGATTAVDVRMGAGQLEVVVPPDATVRASARLGVGEFELLGRGQTGARLQGESRSSGSRPGAGALDLDLRLGAGEITVRRSSAPATQVALESGADVYLACRQTPFGTRCDAPDGYPTPELSCLVSDSNEALCRPIGAGEPDAPWAADPETRRCTIPAGGGRADCTPAERPAGSGEPSPEPPATPETEGTPSTPPTEPGTYVCTIPPGGGPATCRPA